MAVKNILITKRLCGLICALLVGLAGMVWAAGTISISTTTLQNAFPGATVSGSSGKFSVTLQSDVGPVTLKDYYGTLTVNLNGHSITGRVNCATAIEGAALTLTYNSAAGSTKDATYPLKLKLTGTGSVVGGRGVDATTTTNPGVGGYGVYSDGIYNTSYVTNDVNVVIQGGRGGDNYCGGVGGAGGAGYYCKAEAVSYQTTYLYFYNLGTVRGGDGGTGATTGGAGGYGAYFVDISYSKLSANTGTIYGGNGGNGSIGGGAGGSSSNQSVGTRVAGSAGSIDQTLYFQSMFPGSEVEEIEGGHKVTLGADLVSLMVPDNLGTLVIDLNGHSITGQPCTSTTVSATGSAIQFRKVGDGTPTSLTLTGTGLVQGGDAASNSFYVYVGGCGIYAPAMTAGCSLTIGESVVVMGGRGGTDKANTSSTSSGYGRTGGNGVYLTASAGIAFVNNGEVVGGAGGIGAFRAGVGGASYNLSASSPATGIGTFTDGVAGEVDKLPYLQYVWQRYGITELTSGGQYVVTLTNDVAYSFNLRDDCGAFTLDLNGHSIVGYRNSNVPQAVSPIKIVNGTVGSEPTAITFVGPGVVKTVAAMDERDDVEFGNDGVCAFDIATGVTLGTFVVGEGVTISGGDGGYAALAGGKGAPPFSREVDWTGPGMVCNGGYGGDGYATRIAQEFPGAEITPNEGGYTVRLTRDIGGVLIPANRSPFVIDLNGFSIVGAVGTLAETEGEHAITVLNTASGEDFSLTLTGAGTIVGGAGFSGDSSYSADEGGCGIFVDGNATRLTLAVGEGVTVQGGVGGLNLASGCDGAYGGDGVRGSGVDAFTLVNEGQILGGVGGDGDDEGNPGGEAIDLWPSAVTGDSICVTNTVTGVIQGGDGGNGRYSGDGYEAIYVRTYAAFTVENNGEIRGGSSPDAWPDPGVGAEAIGGSSTPTVTGSGTVVRGTDGREDNMKPVKNAFPGATVEMMGTMGVKVTLNDDIGPCVIPDGVGSVTIDLNGYSIIGQSGCSSSADGAALTVRGYGDPVYLPTELTFTGTGSIVGGAGVRSSNDTEATVGGDGIFIDDSVESIFISIGADVTVSGGHGGDAIGRLEVDAADGGCAIDTYASNTFIENAGEIIGGKGGDYVGTYSEGTGADGSEAIYCGGRELTIDNAGIIEGGSGGYGIAESGYANEAIDGGYSTLTVTNREDALIVGGSGGPGGEDGGDGYSAIWAQSSATVTIVNDGTLVGGEGGTAWPYPGEGAVALDVGSGANVTGSGEVVDGEFGMYDMLTPLRESFPNMRLKLDDAGGYVVKLTEDVGPVTLLDNLGPFTIDLNGHSITGNPGCVVNRGGAALVFVPGDGEGLGGTQVSFTGPGAIIGACGLNQTLTDAATDGMPAFCVSNAVSYAVSVSLGDGVTATGGAGGNAFTASGVGRGSVVTDGTLTLQGTTAKGANGVVDVIELLRAAFPSATIVRNENGYLVTLAKYSDPVTLYDNMGPVTINLNGKVVSSRDATAFASAKPAILIAHLDDAGLGPTQLTFTGGGRVQGGNGAAGTATTDPTGGGAAVAVADDVQSGLSVTVETGTSLIGGNGGDADPARGGPVGVGGKAVALGVTRLGDGTFIDGRNGDCDMTAVVAASFPASATVTHVAGGGYQVVLSEDLVGGLVLPDNLGVVALDLNGHSIRGAAGTAETDGGAAITFQTTGVALLGPTELTLAGTGLVAGGDGVNGTTERAPTNGGAAVCADSDDVAAVSVTIGAGVTLRGGNGGDGQRPGDIGAGGATVVAPVVALGDAGTRIDGVDGVCDMTAALAAAFGPTVTIARQDDGSYRVTLTEDVFDIVLPENYGRITIDLNSHAIRGSDATADASANYGIEITYVGRNNMPLDLTFVGPGEVRGGHGGSYSTYGYEAIYSDEFDSVAITIGEEVTVCGGDGVGTGDGGSGIYLDDGADCVHVVNAGTIASGRGGDAGGSSTGGSGYYGLYVYGSGDSENGWAGSLSVTNLATGVISGGDGGNGYSGGAGYYGVYVEYFEQSTFVNLGLVKAGNGGDGEEDGGSAYYAFYGYGFGDFSFENTGTIQGGNGGFGTDDEGGDAEYPVEIGSVENLTFVNTGLIKGGDGGYGGYEGGYADCVVYIDDSASLDFTNTGTLEGGTGGYGGTKGGEGYQGLYFSSIDELVFTNSGTVMGANAGCGVTEGGVADQVVYFSSVGSLDFVNTGTMTGGNGGDGGETGGVAADPTIYKNVTTEVRFETAEGTITPGRNGSINENMLTEQKFVALANACSGVAELTAVDGGWRITLTNDLVGLTLPEDLGAVTIDLNGFTICGRPASDAITVTQVGRNPTPLVLTFEGTGSVIGGEGVKGSDAGDAIFVEEDVDRLSINVGEHVTVQGGKGWCATDGDATTDGGDGGAAIYCEDYLYGTLTINNAGLIAGGDGGDYLGSNSNGNGGDGYYAIYAEGDSDLSANAYALAFHLTNTATGVIRGGNGGSGNDTAGEGYYGLWVKYFEEGTIVNQGLICGGRGGEGANYGGYGESALYLDYFTELIIENDGTIEGGRGTDGAASGDSCDQAVYLSDIGNLVLQNDGTIRAGDVGTGGPYGSSSHYALYLTSIDAGTIVNNGDILGADGTNGGLEGGDADSLIYVSSASTLDFTNTGRILGSCGGNGGSYGGWGDECIYFSSVTDLSFVNAGTIKGNDGGNGGLEGGGVYETIYTNGVVNVVKWETENGEIVDGVPGTRDADIMAESLALIFPDAEISPDGQGGWTVRLTTDQEVVTLSDTMGTITLDLNGHTIKPAWNADAITIVKGGEGGEPLVLNLTGTGSVMGGDGYDQFSTGMSEINGSDAIQIATTVTTATINVGEGVTVRGGKGGNCAVAVGGNGGKGVNKTTSQTGVVVTGVVGDGARGIYDSYLLVAQQFANNRGVEVTSDGQGGSVITLLRDISQITIPDNCGKVAIDLNGHTIQSGSSGVAAITISNGGAGKATELELVGPGAVLGRNGTDRESESYNASLEGTAAIQVTANSYAYLASLTVGEGVLVKGGDAGTFRHTYASSANGGTGGVAVYYAGQSTNNFTLVNAGTIQGGHGGTYVGRYSGGVACPGAKGVYVNIATGKRVTITNAETGVIAGGDGGDLLKYDSSSIGSSAGAGGSAISLYKYDSASCTYRLTNDGQILGGDGGYTEKTSGTVAAGGAALNPASGGNGWSVTTTNRGTITNGTAGMLDTSASVLSALRSVFNNNYYDVAWDSSNRMAVVTLNKDYSGVTLPDNLGKVKIDFSGHSILGTSTKAAVSFSHPSSTVTTPTHLILTGMGSVTGYDNPGSATEAAGDGGVAFSLPAGTAAVTIDVGEGVTVRGGKGGDSTVEPGQGGLAVQMANGVSATFTGVLTDGADGQLCESATEQLVRSAFPTATVERNDAGGYTVTLTEDIGSVSLPDNLGPVTLDLNGHSIAATTRGTAGLTFVATTPNETPTQLTITGEGTIVGAKGNDSSSSSAACQGGAGISINRPNVVVTVGEDVEVRGGEGGDNTYKNRGGNGGVGVAVSAANVTLNVAGTVSGGEGGHYTGTTYNYLGGAGGSGVTVSSTVGFVLDNAGLIQGGSGSGAGTGFSANGCNTAYQGMVTLTNEANGVIRGGTSWDDGSGLNGGDGIYDYAYGSIYVNLGLIAGGDGNDGGSDGGAGGVGVHAYGSSLYPSQLLNEGTIAGGNGGFGEMFGGAGASAFTGSFYCELVNEGELVDGAFGPSTFNDAFQVQYPGIEVTKDGNSPVLTLTEDLHDTLVFSPSAWGFTGYTIELDMNGHSIYGPDGTAEHPDGGPGILCDDADFDFGAQWNGLKIYDSTQSSNSVIRGGHGYPSSTDAPGGNGGDGITAPNAGLRTKVVSDIDGIQIWGGNGGENTGTGDGGNGGCAIRGEPHYLQDVEFHGGDGGDAITGDGGDGGDAILGFIGESDIGGNIWLYGGKGGNSQAGDGGNGGHGQHSDPHEDNYYFTRGIFYFGGDGGSSIDGDGGNGGNGLWGFAGEWNGGTILHGGDGGTSVNGDGGNGGDGLRGDGESLGGRDDPHETTGGNGGASVNGMGGNGGNGITYIPYDDSYRKAETATTFHLQLDSEGGEGADGFFRGLGGSGVVFGDDPHQGGEELNVTSSTSSNGPDGHGLNWEYPVVGPGILDWQDLIDDPWIANTYIGETNAYMTVSIDGGEPIQVRYNDTDGTFLPEQIIFGGETDTVHHVTVQFHTSSTRITATRPTGKVKDWGFKPYDINIKVPVTHPESEPFSLSNLGTVPAAEEKGKTILCDARIDTTANLDENGRQLDSTVNPAPTKAPTTGTMDYWYVAQNPRSPDDTSDTLAMTAPTLSAREPTTFTVGGIEGLSKFSWEMFLKEGTGKAAIKGDLTLSVVKTLDGVVTTNTYTYTAADLENNWKGQDFTFDGPTNAMYDVTFTYTNNSDGDGQALVDNIRWNPLGASLMIVDHEDPGYGYVYLAFQPQLRGTRRTSANVWVQRLIAHGLRAKRGASRAQMEKFAPAEVTFSDRADHQAATDRVWVKVPLAELEQNKGYWRVAVDDAELSFKDFDSTLVDPPAIRSSSSEKDARSVNVFGILKVMSANTNTLVAIPWTWYSAQEKNAADIPVNKLVKTTNLTDGDWLYSHLTDADGNGHYAAWMVQGGRWKAITTVMREGGDDGAGSVMRVGDDSVSIPRGNGVWLVRQRPFEVVNNVTNPIPFWVYGQSVTNAVETEVRPGPGGTYADGSVKAYSTVLGNPYGEATRVNDLQFVGEILGGGVQGDCIVVPSGTSAEKRFYRGLGPQPDKWCWTEMKLVKGRPKTTYDYDVTVPPGLAFWYERRGSGALKVVWPYKPEVPETEGN